jgi:hypothetical protein
MVKGEDVVVEMSWDGGAFSPSRACCAAMITGSERGSVDFKALARLILMTQAKSVSGSRVTSALSAGSGEWSGRHERASGAASLVPGT